MHIVALVVTRNVSVSIKSLHSLLNLSKCAIQMNNTLDINFVKDDVDAKNSFLAKSLKKCDRLIWIDYGIYVDDKSLVCMSEKFPQGFASIVCPCVTENISWDQFKKKILEGSTEPISQMALEFDTKTSKNIGDKFSVVTSTAPRCWAVDTKHVLKALKNQKGEGIILPTNSEELFKKMMDRGVRVCAFMDAKLIATYAHECIGNILESANVKAGDGKENIIN